MVRRDTPQQRPVLIQSGGKRLFGMLHASEKATPGRGVVFINSGLQYRVGPHRFYVELARLLAQHGIASLRLDLSGLGDSDGQIEEIHFDCHDPQDTIAGVNFLVEHEIAARVSLIGICAGARNAVKAAVQLPSVDSVILCSLPIITDMPTMPVIRKENGPSMSRAAARSHLARWLKKGVSPHSWRTYFATGGDWKNLFESFKGVVFGGLLGRNGAWADQRHKDFFQAMDGCLKSKRRILSIYGEKDSLGRGEFEEHFPSFAAGEQENCTLFVVPQGDHNFSSEAAQSIVRQKVIDWLAASQ